MNNCYSLISMTSSNYFILVRVAVHPEPILETHGMRREYNLDGTLVQFKVRCIHTFIHLELGGVYLGQFTYSSDMFWEVGDPCKLSKICTGSPHRQ